MNIKSPTITAHEDTDKSRSDTNAKTKLDGIATELGIEKPKGARSKDAKDAARTEGVEGGFVDEDDSGLSPDDKS